MSKFVQVEVACEIQYGSGETKWEPEMVMLNTAHIVRFTTYGNMIWLTDGQRYFATQRGINHLMESVDKYGVEPIPSSQAREKKS